MELIVARYNEDINWIKENNLNKITTLYCKEKKDDIDQKDYLRVYELPNVGREGQTYLHHIIQNYDNLADVNIFVQANPFDHCSSSIDFIKNNINSFQGYKPFPTFSWPIVNFLCRNLNIPHIRNICEELFINPPSNFDTWFNGMFIVSKSTIRMRSKDFYKKCLSYVIHSNNPIEGHVLERIWVLIFNPEIKSKI